MAFAWDLLARTAVQVGATFARNWPFLLFGVLVAAWLQTYVDQNRVAAFLQRHRGRSVVLATGAAVGTPLCSCGTTAVVLSMMASTMPWAPIVAFMVASPLTSPAELLYSAGLFGWPFAVAFFAASIMLGLAGGAAAHVLERRGWLAGQARYRPIAGGSGLDAGDVLTLAPAAPRKSVMDFLRAVRSVGWRLVKLFFGFAFIGYLLNNLIPATAVATLFGSGHSYGVVLAATLGIPLYFNTEASLPLVAAFLQNGMSPGAALAFLVTGAGTSVGAIAGVLTIARWRVVGLVVATLWTGAVALGYLYNLFT